MHNISPEIISGFDEIRRDDSRTAPIKDRLHLWAEKFIERPYIDNPLTDGENRLRFDGFDCMTFVETCLALSISESPDEVLSNLDRIRYRDGRVGFDNRNHFVSADWLPNDNWLLEVEDELANSQVTRTIDRGEFFTEKGHPLPPNHPLVAPQEVTLPYISVDRAMVIEPHRLDGKVAFFIGDLEWLIVRHMGLTFNEDENAVLIHASSVSRRVEKELLCDYLDGRDNIMGIAMASLRAYCDSYV